MRQLKIFFLPILFMIQSALLFAQQKLQFEILNCQSSNKSWGEINYLSLFNDQKFITIIETDEYGLSKKDFKEGKYEIKYTSIFGKEKIIPIEIKSKGNKPLNIIICADYIDYEKEEYIPFIKRLAHGEEYSIQIFSSGCFHFSKDTISISKTNQEYYVSYKGNKRQLNEQDITTLRNFELGLNALKIGNGCTSSTFYTILYKDNIVFEKTDDTCKWNGLYEFIKKLE